jgi:hypothetical protein
MLDWGLAKVRGRADLDEAVVTSRSEDDAHMTRIGTIKVAIRKAQEMLA